jgi:ECF transporter S component (folate family)
MKINRNLLFKSPFSLLYWKIASRELKIIQTIVLTSILVSISLVIETLGKSIPIYFFDRQIMFVFLPQALISMLFGPIVGMLSGAIIDILGFVVFSPGFPFFPGYTISSVCSSLIFSLFLYRSRITVFRLFTSKLLVNLLINVGLGSLWMAILTSWNALPALLIGGLIKNLVLLPIEVFLLYYLMKGLIPVTKAHFLISENIPDKIALI